MVQQIPIYGKYGVTLPRLNRKDVFHCGSHTLVYVKYKDVEPYIMEAQNHLTTAKVSKLKQPAHV